MKPECIHISGFTHKEDTLTPHGPPSMKCGGTGGTYPDSGSSELVYLTNKHNHYSRIWEIELPKIITENRKVYKILDFDITKTYVDPSWPPSMECDATYPYSGLIQHGYLTKKHHHIKKWEAE